MGHLLMSSERSHVIKFLSTCTAFIFTLSCSTFVDLWLQMAAQKGGLILLEYNYWLGNRPRGSGT